MRIELRKIMSTTDISEFSNHTLVFGAALAREFEARLYACHVISLPSIATYYGNVHIDPEEEQQRWRDYIQTQFEEQLGALQIDWQPLVTIGHTADEITRLAAENDIDLVITATHGRSGLKRLVLGSVTARLMRTLPCPLLIIREPVTATDPSGMATVAFKRILVGCDFSNDSAAAFQYALALAQEFEAQIYLVHVIEPSVYVDVEHTTMEFTAEDPLELETHLRTKLNTLLPEEAAHWCSPQVVILKGLSYDEIVRFAQNQNVDLIVLGARGYSLAEKLFVGSTTDRVARRAPCPVLSVAPKNATA